jgi:hypothetical protein
MFVEKISGFSWDFACALEMSFFDFGWDQAKEIDDVLKSFYL